MKPPESRLAALVLLLLTLAPYIGVGLWVYLCVWPGTWITTAESVRWFWTLVSFELAVVLAAAGVTVYYIVLVYRGTESESERYFWVTTLLSWYPLSAPVFWYRVIWKRMPVSLATTRA